MNNRELEKIINNKLKTHSMKLRDFVPNGLQIEGRKEIKKVITGVTACQELLDNAISDNADAIIVHHGYFWRNEPSIITGIKKNRIKSLLMNDINLYAWHLPLDIHPDLGNNVQLSKILEIKVLGFFSPIVPYGKFTRFWEAKELCNFLTKKLQCRIFHCCGESAPKIINNVAWCSGKGQELIELATDMDAFISGEISENTFHIAKECNMHFFSIGHHISEIGGIQALGKWIHKNLKIDVKFINIHNPI